MPLLFIVHPFHIHTIAHVHFSLEGIMRQIETSDTVTFPEGVTFTVKNRIVHVTGPRGTLRSDFRHLYMEMERVGKNQLRVRKWSVCFSR